MLCYVIFVKYAKAPNVRAVQALCDRVVQAPSVRAVHIKRRNA